MYIWLCLQMILLMKKCRHVTLQNHQPFYQNQLQKCPITPLNRMNLNHLFRTMQHQRVCVFISDYLYETFSPKPSLPLTVSNRNIYGEFSGHDRSHSRPPINHSYRQEEAAQALFHTPTIHKPHPSMQRRFTYPPTPGYSICTPSSSDLVSLSV